MRRDGAQSGFALLMVLVLVMLAAVALAGLARHSMVGALEARDAIETMQRRWAVRSCQRTLLHRAAPLLDAAERGTDGRGNPAETYQNDPMPELRVTCELIGGTYELIITDEQAKVNVNRLFPLPKDKDLASIVERLPPRTLASDDAARVRPRLLVMDRVVIEGELALPLIRSYDQLFIDPDPAMLAGSADDPSLVRSVTCWGDGKVNLRRASDEVIMAACSEPLGRTTASLLVRAREEDPYAPLSDMLGREDRIDAGKRAAVRQYVTDRSSAHALWIVAHDGKRARHYLTIRAEELAPPDEDGQIDQNRTVSRTYTYAW